VPLRTFALDIAGGQASAFTLQDDLCAPATDLDFTAVIGPPGDQQRLAATATATYRQR
jgi:hypothetical protein